MKIKDVIEDLQRFADRVGEDAEFILYDRTEDKELRTDVEDDDWDFEILCGDNQVVIEFN